MIKKYPIKRFDNNNIKSVSGSNIRLKYQNKFDKDGNKLLKVIGKIDIYNEIQLHKDDTDIYKIISRYLGGDISKLDSNMIQRGNSFYGDVSQMPDNINDFANYMNDLKYNFDLLPVDIKQKFDNSFMKFGNSVFDNTFIDTILSDNDIVSKYNLKNNYTGIVSNANINNINTNNTNINNGGTADESIQA